MSRITGGGPTGQGAGSLQFTATGRSPVRNAGYPSPCESRNNRGSGFSPGAAFARPLARFATRWSRWEIGEIWRASARAVWRSRPSRKCWSLSRNFHQRFIVTGGRPPGFFKLRLHESTRGRLELISEIIARSKSRFRGYLKKTLGW